jgi:hypothetical protein
MPTAVIQTNDKKRDGNVKIQSVTKSVTHNNARLFYDGGRTYYYVGDDASGNRIYREA